MKTIYLDPSSIHTGSLILVNQDHGYQEDPAAAMVPVTEEHPEILLHRSAAVLLNQLMEELNGWDSMVPVSGWRSLAEQQKIWDSSLEENGLKFTQTYVAYPGHSEHQTGLAIDLGLKQEHIDFIRPDFPYKGICQRFREMAATYGFVERYPQAKASVTKIGHEPWHFRYVGVPHAQIMVQRGLVLEEYINETRQFRHGEHPLLVQSEKQELEVSFVPAEQGQTALSVDDTAAYVISGNNVDGWIVTQWRKPA